jgi:hypothetical protein
MLMRRNRLCRAKIGLLLSHCARISGVALAAACSPVMQGANEPLSGEAQEIREFLVRDLRTQVQPGHGRPDQVTTRFVDQQSIAIPELVYHWGVYTPPNTGDLFYRSVFASRSGRTAPVMQVQGWATVAGDWLGNDQADAVAACEELVQVAVERWPARPTVFREGDSVRNFMVREPEFLETKLSPPTVDHGNESAIVRLWVIGARDLTNYVCEFGPATASIEVQEVLKGYGTRPSLRG